MIGSKQSWIAFCAASLMCCLSVGAATEKRPEERDSKKAGKLASKIFESPVRVMVADKPLNTAAKMKFPSPAILDIDDDGQSELVVGSLMGAVGVYENTNTSGKGDPVWGPRKPLKDAAGETIRTSNW